MLAASQFDGGLGGGMSDGVVAEKAPSQDGETDSINGIDALVDLIRLSVPERQALQVVNALLVRFGTTFRILRAAPEKLLHVPGVTPEIVIAITSAHKIHRCFLYQQIQSSREPTCVAAIENYFTERFNGIAEDTFSAVSYSQGEFCHLGRVTRGEKGQVTVYVRDVVGAALQHHATSLYLVFGRSYGSDELTAAERKSVTAIQASAEALDIDMSGVILIRHGSDQI